jgi:hypothetical protein
LKKKINQLSFFKSQLLSVPKFINSARPFMRSQDNFL